MMMLTDVSSYLTGLGLAADSGDWKAALGFTPPAPDRVASFQQIVRRSVPCFIRKPRGLDIFAACGQLKRVTVPV